MPPKQPQVLAQSSSESNSSRLTIPTKLNSENYRLWSFQIKMLLSVEKLVDETLAATGFQVLDNSKAKMAICINCSPEVLNALLDLETAPIMWTYLFETYAGKNRSRLNSGIKALAGIVYDAKLSALSNLLALNKIMQDTVMAAGEDTIKITDLGLAMFLNALPPSFAVMRSHLEQSNTDFDYQVVKKAMIAEEERMGARAISQTPGFAGSVKKRSFNSTPSCEHNQKPSNCWTCDPSKHPSKQTCTDCGKLGHYNKRSNKCEHYVQKPGGSINSVTPSSSQQGDNEDWTPLTPRFGFSATRHANSSAITRGLDAKKKLHANVAKKAKVKGKDYMPEDLRNVLNAHSNTVRAKSDR